MMEQETIVDSEKLYAYKIAGEKECHDFAIKATANHKGFDGLCFLSPPDHPHMIKGKLGKRTKTGFTFIAGKESYAPGVWEFYEVDFDNFRGKYHKICMDGGKSVLAEVGNTEELVEFYRNLR